MTEITIGPAKPDDIPAMSRLPAEMDRFYGSANAEPEEARERQIHQALFGDVPGGHASSSRASSSEAESRQPCHHGAVTSARDARSRWPRQPPAGRMRGVTVTWPAHSYSLSQAPSGCRRASRSAAASCGRRGTALVKQGRGWVGSGIHCARSARTAGASSGRRGPRSGSGTGLCQRPGGVMSVSASSGPQLPGG
jgi:hypothetical protein